MAGMLIPATNKDYKMSELEDVKKNNQTLLVIILFTVPLLLGWILSYKGDLDAQSALISPLSASCQKELNRAWNESQERYDYDDERGHFDYR